MELLYEFTWTWNRGIAERVQFGAGPYGSRAMGVPGEGVVRGERINGRVLPGGGDWVLFGSDGYARPDVRVQLETSDGAFIFMAYGGVVEWDGAVSQAMASGGSTDYDEHYWRCVPRLETGDERYYWVNQTVFVSRGRITGDGNVEYEVYSVT